MADAGEPAERELDDLAGVRDRSRRIPRRRRRSRCRTSRSRPGRCARRDAWTRSSWRCDAVVGKPASRATCTRRVSAAGDPCELVTGTAPPADPVRFRRIDFGATTLSRANDCIGAARRTRHPLTSRRVHRCGDRSTDRSCRRSAAGSSAACSGSPAYRSACAAGSSTPSPEAPAGAVGPLVVGALGDERALGEVADGATVVTYEWEGVPAAGARLLEARLPVRPGPVAARRRPGPARREGHVPPSRHRRRRVRGGRRPRRARPPRSSGSGTPAILKTRRGGYDGKGQVVLRDASDAASTRRGRELGRRGALILEAMVPFDRELSVLAVRGLDGDDGLLPARRERAPRRHPARQPGAGTRRRRRARRAGRDDRARSSSTTSTTSACSRSSCSRSAARCSRTRSRRACTTPGTGRSRARRRASSRTTCAPSSAGRSARPRRAGTARWSTASARCPTATRCSRCRARTSTTTARLPDPNRKVGHVTLVAPTPEELEVRLDRLPSSIRPASR